VGALSYAPLSRRMVIDFVYGWVYMVTTLAFLELAARACPPHVEGTFFALLMSVYNAGQQFSHWSGGHLYDRLGLQPLVLISAVLTVLTLALVPLVRIDALEARARATAT
jgi:predicted MFS family arabinose efflux permease